MSGTRRGAREDAARRERTGYISAVKRKRVGVLFGGRSSEHEVSVRSAASVFANLDRKRYDSTAIYIDPEGRWTLPSRPPDASTDA